MATAPKAVPKAPLKSAPAEPPAAAAPKKSGKKLMLIVLILVILLGAGGGLAWYFLGNKASGSTPAKVEAKPPVFVVLEPFTVNLQPEDNGDQYLQVAFSLQVADQKDVDIIKQYLPQVRSRLLLLLSGKTASEILTIEGKKALSDEIVAQVKLPFVPGTAPQNVTNVFFTSFVIQ